MKITDPKIPTEVAYSIYDKQVQLADILGLSTSTVNGWGKYVPPVNAWRLVHAFPVQLKRYIPPKIPNASESSGDKA